MDHHLFGNFPRRRPRPQPGIQPEERNFTCTACLDVATARPISVGGDDVCHTCFEAGVRPLFEAALKSESQYPVMWGIHDLTDITPYLSFFSADFHQQWEAKKKEYETPLQHRIYCKHVLLKDDGLHEECGTFLGKKGAQPRGFVVCNHECCRRRTCARCSMPIAHTQIDHDCDGKLEDAEIRDSTRGVDYQLCPNKDCLLRISLHDGCNSMECQFCQTEFCFVCGEKSTKDHWTLPSICPRFGPRRAGAIYDDHIPNLARQPPGLQRLRMPEAPPEFQDHTAPIFPPWPAFTMEHRLPPWVAEGPPNIALTNTAFFPLPAGHPNIFPPGTQFLNGLLPTDPTTTQIMERPIMAATEREARAHGADLSRPPPHLHPHLTALDAHQMATPNGLRRAPQDFQPIRQNDEGLFAPHLRHPLSSMPAMQNLGEAARTIDDMPVPRSLGRMPFVNPPTAWSPVEPPGRASAAVQSRIGMANNTMPSRTASAHLPLPLWRQERHEHPELFLARSHRRWLESARREIRDIIDAQAGSPHIAPWLQHTQSLVSRLQEQMAAANRYTAHLAHNGSEELDSAAHDRNMGLFSAVRDELFIWLPHLADQLREIMETLTMVYNGNVDGVHAAANDAQMADFARQEDVTRREMEEMIHAPRRRMGPRGLRT